VVVLRGLMAIIGAVLIIGAVGLGSFLLAMFVIDQAWPTSGGSKVEPPHTITVSTNFSGNPHAVLVCWQSAREDAKYDLLIRHWDLGNEWEEMKREVGVFECGEAQGTAYIFSNENLYHLALRTCVKNSCSDWAPVTEGDRYWLRIPCRDAEGSGCFHRGSDSSVRAQ
jgi:hypothetical protein